VGTFVRSQRILGAEDHLTQFLPRIARFCKRTHDRSPESSPKHGCEPPLQRDWQLVAARIVIVSFVPLVSRGLIAVELFRQARQRSILNVVAALMAAYALFGAVRAIATFLHGPPYDFMQTSRFQIPSLVVNLLFICIIGLFFLLMLSSELVAIVEAQSLYDHVSGALNRRHLSPQLSSLYRFMSLVGMQPDRFPRHHGYLL
jgi:hypothetical protein